VIVKVVVVNQHTVNERGEQCELERGDWSDGGGSSCDSDSDGDGDGDM